MPFPLTQSDLDRTRQVYEQCGCDAKKTAEALGLKMPATYSRLRKAGIKKHSRAAHVSRQAETPIDEDTEKVLWSQYSEDPSDTNRNKIAEFYHDWLEKCVVGICRRKGIRDWRSFLTAAGKAMLGAITRFDASQETPFTAYFTPRLRGAILDECRSIIPMHNDEEELREMGRFVRSDLEAEEAFQAIVKGLQLREQVLLYLIYCCDVSSADVAGILNLSETRTSQVHREALAALRQLGREHYLEAMVG